MDKLFRFPKGLLPLCGLMLSIIPALANTPGGGNGTGPNVTLTTNTSANTITMDNGIVTAVISINSSQILELSYLGHQVTDGGTGDTDAFYWQGQSTAGEETPINGILSVPVNCATNGGNSAEISIANLYTNQGTNSPFVADAYYHFTMFRGSPGIYATEIMSRTTSTPSGGADIPSFTCKLDGSFFNWLAQDNGRNLLRETPTESDNATAGINNAPKEVTLLNQGLLAGQFECKYDYAGDLGLLHFIGWCSTNQTTNFGLWMVHPTREYWSGGPGHPEIVGQIDMLNCTFKGVHFGFGSDLNFTNGETWSRVCGPVFLYFNQVPPGTASPWIPLYADVYAQAAAEGGAWPYSWLTATNYAGPSSRGAVSGTLVISDSGNPNASAAGMWVGVLQQPPSSLDPPTTDFQNMDKGYQFWVKTDANGHFTISNVVAGANYTLLSYGPGAIGLYQSQSFGTAPPVTLYIPPTPFSITVTAGQTNNLGNVTWVPTRVGPTVWEIGVPDRDTREFRHGTDYWHGDLGNATNFAANWAPWQDYTLDFPNGVNYTNGLSRWSADWPNAQPNSLSQTTGDLNNTTQNIFFNLAGAPSGGAKASLYFAFAADYQTPVLVTINGVNAGTVTPAYSTDAMIRLESHGIFCDARLSISASDLKAGQNEIQLTTQKSGYFADSVLYDYIRLELTGYIPPAPAGLAAIAGNGLVVLDWPASSGATSYNVLRSTTSGSGYLTIVTNVIGPVVGSDVPDATYTDNSVVNGTTYYYEVQAANPDGTSADSMPASATPSAATPAAPSAPTGLTLTPGNAQVTLYWNPSPGAATYAIQRTVITGGAVPKDPGAEIFTNPDGSAPTNVVNSFITGTNYTDTGLANGVVYLYIISAANANGQSANSAEVSATPEPLIPATPTGLGATLGVSNLVTLSWNPANYASSYVLQRATSISGPYTAVDYPAWLSFFTDGPLSNNTIYYYEVASASLAGISTNSAPVSVSIGPATPSLTAVASNAAVSLIWTASAGATNYVLQSSTTSGGPYTTILTMAATNYLNTGLVNGTTYYYVVYALGPYGQSSLSAQASATPSLVPAGNWINTITASPQSWNVGGNWANGVFPNSTQAVVTINSAIAANQTIDLNQAITIGAMNIGSPSDAASFNVTGNGGTLTLDNTPGTALLQQLSTSKGDTISAPMAVNGGLLVTNASTNTFTLSGNISGATNGVTLNGPVTLGGINTYTGNTTVLTGNVTVSGGSINAPNSTITIGNGATGVSLSVTGGTVTANTLNVAPEPNSTGDSASLTGSGSALFTNVNLGGTGDTSGLFTINTTGSVALGALIDYKDLEGTGPSTTSGLIINNGTVTATSVIIQNTGSGANMNMTGGSLTIGNASSSGAFKIGNSTSTRGGFLTMTGGSLTYMGTDGLLLNTASGGANGANISGATSVVTLTGITLNQVNAAGATSWLVVSNGATLYLGGVGLVINQPGTTVYASLGTATVGAIANWSSSAPITLNANTTFQAADTSRLARDISLGGALSGVGGLTKTGAGVLTLSAANTYAGGTTISAGTLLANNSAGSGTGAGSVTVTSSATLGGAGVISGAVTVNSGGTLAPGNPLGALTINNNLTLAAGSTTVVQVQHSPLTNDAAKVSGTLAAGGTLSVTNIAAAALAAGDSFKFFSAGNYAGAFANVLLPPLPAGLGWNTNALNTAGALSVVVVGVPAIGACSLLPNGLVLAGTGGVAGANYYLLASTNLTMPISDWTPLLTNQFDSDGNFNFTNPPVPGQPQEFYMLELP
jgi:rhamnogalacturonan endolyase